MDASSGIRKQPIQSSIAVGGAIFLPDPSFRWLYLAVYVLNDSEGLWLPHTETIRMDLTTAIFVLRKPTPDDESRKRKLRVFSYILPLIKNPQNIWVMIQELAVSPGVFDTDPLKLAATSAYATDAVAAAVHHKHQISDPTVKPSLWERSIKEAAYTVPPLVGLILLAGLANHGHHKYTTQVTEFIKVVCKDPSLVPSAAFCLSRVELTSAQLSEIPCDSLALTIIRYVYNSSNLSLASPAISSHLGVWSRLLRALLQHAHISTLQKYLTTIQLFVRTVIARSYPPEELRSLYFGLIIQLEGVVCFMLRNTAVDSFAMRVDLAIAILQMLQPLGYVGTHVGTQFESYQFVFCACLDTLSMPPVTSGKALEALSENWGYGQPLTASDAEAGELVFLFEVAEQLMPTLDGPTAESGVLTIARRFIIPPASNSTDVFHTPVFEAAHSVMLAYLATHHSLRFSKRNMALDYFAEVMQLFPGFLTGSQLRTAVLTVISSLDKPDINRALHQVFHAAKISIPGVTLAKTELKTEPPTVRAALVSTLLHGVSQYCDSAELHQWLETISTMVPSISSETTRLERQFMLKDFADVATSGGDVGVIWWFKHYEGRL